MEILHKLLFGMVFLFLIGGVQAVTITPISPESLPNVSMGCGEIEIVHLKLNLDNYENISVSWQTKYSLSDLYTGFDKTYFTNPYNGPNDRQLYISYFTADNCVMGTQTRTLNIGDETYDITVIVKEDLYLLNGGFPFTLEEGEKFSIGNTVHFNLINVDSNSVDYLLEGCGSSDDKLYKGDVLDKICGTERLGVEIDEILGGESVVTLYISFSTESLELKKSDSNTNGNPSGCELGLSTFGAKVKRGNIFAIKTIDINTDKFEKGVGVTILDQEGELSPIAGVSSNIGFFSERLHEDYGADLIVQLEKEDCEPYTEVILFEKSYDDYKKAKGEEEGAYQLVLNMSARYEMKEISGTIKNELNEVIEGVEVKITRPDNTILTVQTNANGLFSFTPIIVGTYKLQGGKDDYQSTDLISIEVYQNKNYLIVIKVDGESKSEYRSGDRLTFELRDENNTLLALSIDATFAGLPLRFVSGISDAIIFEDTSTLVIPTIEGYATQSLVLTKKEPNWTSWLYWILIIGGIIVALVVIGFIIRKVRGGGKESPQMEVQLSRGGE